MDAPVNALSVFVGLFSSRKNQVALAAFIVAVLAAFGLKDYPPEIVVTVIAAAVTLGATVINSIKAEDVAKHTAAGMLAAANVTAAATATTTTLTTPASNVQVSATDEPKPPAPTLGDMG